MTATVTSSPTNTPRPTTAVSLTPDDLATSKANETASINTIILTVQPATLENHPSPDGKWQAEVIRYDCINYPYPDYTAIIAYEQLKLMNLTDGTEQIIEDQLQNCDGIGGGGLKGLYWSPNNHYFYYTDWREGNPESCGNYIAPTIYRYDTLTQENIMVGGGHLSPDKKKLAMWVWQKNEIAIWDLDKGEVGRVTLLKTGLAKGKISWSFDSKAILYVQTESECAPDYGTTYITRLDLSDYSQSLLIEYSAPEIEITGTPVPVDVFALLLYPPLVMKYDSSIWQDESQYDDTRLMPVYFITNTLQALQFETCRIGLQGPMGDIPATPEVVQLGPVRYEMFLFTEVDSVLAYYIESTSLSGFNYDNGTAVLRLEASLAEWKDCKVLAEKVLSTLHVP